MVGVEVLRAGGMRAIKTLHVDANVGSKKKTLIIFLSYFIIPKRSGLYHTVRGPRAP
jgi:hypothetical protein